MGAPVRCRGGVLVCDVLAVWAFAAVWTGALCLLAVGLVSLNHVMTIAVIQGTWALWGAYYYMTTPRSPIVFTGQTELTAWSAFSPFVLKAAMMDVTFVVAMHITTQDRVPSRGPTRGGLL